MLFASQSARQPASQPATIHVAVLLEYDNLYTERKGSEIRIEYGNGCFEKERTTLVENMLEGLLRRSKALQWSILSIKTRRYQLYNQHHHHRTGCLLKCSISACFIFSLLATGWETELTQRWRAHIWWQTRTRQWFQVWGSKLYRAASVF